MGKTINTSLMVSSCVLMVGCDSPNMSGPSHCCFPKTLAALIATMLGCAVLAAQQTPTAPATVEAAIGIVRADGVMVPLATLRDRAWQPLSEQRSGDSVMTQAGSALPLEGWTLFPVAGGNSRVLRLTKPVSVGFECSQAEAFDTSISAPIRLRGTDTAKPLGLAVRGNAKPQAATDLLTSLDAAGLKTRALITSTVQALEFERFEAALKNHPDLGRFNPAQGRSPAVMITRLWRHNASGADWHYFEAQKEYPGVGIAFWATGWIAASGTDSYVTDLKAGFGSTTDSPDTDVIAVIPGEPFQGATWIMALHSDVDLIYTLVQVGAEAGDIRSWRHVLDVWVNHCLP